MGALHIDKHFVSENIQLLDFLSLKFQLSITSFSTVFGVDFHPAAESKKDLLRGLAGIILIVALLILTRLESLF